MDLDLNQGNSKKYNPLKKCEDAEYTKQTLTEKLRKKGHGEWSN